MTHQPHTGTHTRTHTPYLSSRTRSQSIHTANTATTGAYDTKPWGLLCKTGLREGPARKEAIDESYPLPVTGESRASQGRVKASQG